MPLAGSRRVTGGGRAVPSKFLGGHWLKTLAEALTVVKVQFLNFARVVKWQTRTFEGRMPQGMRVQVPPRAFLQILGLHQSLGTPATSKHRPQGGTVFLPSDWLDHDTSPTATLVPRYAFDLASSSGVCFDFGQGQKEEPAPRTPKRPQVRTPWRATHWTFLPGESNSRRIRHAEYHSHPAHLDGRPGTRLG